MTDRANSESHEESGQDRSDLDAYYAQLVEEDRDLRAVDNAQLAEVALQSPLIKFLLERAEDRSREAEAKIMETDPTDVDMIRLAQNEYWRAKTLGAWIKSILDEGEAALGRIQLEEASDA